MTQVDFHVLSESSAEARLHYLCRLTEKALKRSTEVWIQVDNRQAAEEVSRKLWDFKPQSFVPHKLADSPGDAPVQIAWDQDPGLGGQLLVSMVGTTLDHFSRFDRVIEIVVQQQQQLVQSRDKWKYYQQCGFPLKSHSIETKVPGSHAG